MTSQAIPGNACAFSSCRAALDLNPLPAWLCDPEMSRFLGANEAAVVRYGYSRAEFLSIPVDRVFSPVGGSWRHRMKCGRSFDAAIRAGVIASEDGDALLVVAQDLPAWRRAEEILSASYARGRLFAQDLDDVVTGALSCLCRSLDFAVGELWTSDDDGEFLRCTACWRQPGLDASVNATAGARVTAGTPESILAWVLAESKPCWTRGIAAEPGYAERAAALKNAGISAGTAFAVRHGSSMHGSGINGVVVLLGRSHKPPDPQATELLAEWQAKAPGLSQQALFREIFEQMHPAPTPAK